MQSVEGSLIELDRLLTPISVENPSGPSLRYEGTYDRIQEARRADDVTLSQGIWKTDLKQANWGEVESICLDALESKSKDIQIAAWLLEALLHNRGFAGVAEGLNIMTEICEAFWETLHPGSPTPEGMEARVAPFEWVNEKLSISLKLLPITAPRSAEAFPYSLSDSERAEHLEKVAQKDPGAFEKATAGGAVTRAAFQRSVMLSAVTFFVETNARIQTAIDSCDVLSRFLDEKCTPDGPSFLGFRKILLDIQALMVEILKERQDEIESGIEEGDATRASTWPQEARIQTRIRNRAEAYLMLSEAADYLFRTEPHSPVPYLVRRAVAWGTMSLEQVLDQVVRNEGERKEIFRLLQMPRPR